jgi:HK97 family phage portal protein
MSLKTRIKSLFGIGIEGSYRGPAWGQSELGNWFEIPFGDGFQRNLDMRGISQASSTVFACKALLSSLGAQLPFQIINESADGERIVDKSSDAARVLLRPNDFQTAFEFFEGLLLAVLTHGNAYAIIQRNQRNGISALVPVGPRSIHAHIVKDDQTGEVAVFYAVSSDGFNSLELVVPARDILHIKIHADASMPLRGRSPIEHAGAAMGLHGTIAAGLQAYHARAGRLGSLLTTDANINATQITQLREAWEKVSTRWAQGGTAVLGGGLKTVDVAGMGANAADAQLLELMHASDKEVCRVFRVPPELIGLEPTVGRSAAEASRFLQLQALGPLVETVEQALSRAFGLDGVTHWVQADFGYITRTDEAAKWQSIESSVRSGVVAINEARKAQGLKAVKNGDEPLVQQQDLPLSLAAKLADATIENLARQASQGRPSAAPTPAAPTPADVPPADKFLTQDQVKARVADKIRQITRSSI